MLFKAIKDAVKKYLWFHVPYDKYIRIMYLLSPGFKKEIEKARIESRVSRFVVSAKTNRKIRIVFLCQSPQVWNSFKSVWTAAKNDPEIESYILALPEKVMHENYDVNHEEYEPVNKSFNMCREFEKDTINAYDYSSGKWFDLKGLEPDYVFLPRPYDIHLPPCYRSTELKNYAKVCFVNYGHDTSIWSEKITYNLGFVANISLIFAESQYIADILNKALAFLRFPYLRVVFLGFPRFDLYSNSTYGGGGIALVKL